MKKLTNLKQFKNILPYSSEIFGVYQPLLGWKSKRIEVRIRNGFNADKTARSWAFYDKLRGKYEGKYKADIYHVEEIESINIGIPKRTIKRFDTAILNEITETLPPEEEITNDIWQEIISQEFLTRRLSSTVVEKVRQWALKMREELNHSGLENKQEILAKTLQDRLNRESVTAAILLDLVRNGQYSQLQKIFYDKKTQDEISLLLEMEEYKDPFDFMDPKKDLDRVGLSPIGIVHLFRQYFFEFDSFLGVPVGHIWASPGSIVELIEVSTRKILTEKTIETGFESIVKSESNLSIEDEISDAVKEDNKNDMKFGANVSASESWVWGSANQSASFDMNTTQQTAREQTHKHMRKQSQKLSTEIRKNYKSTFKTVTEYTDTSSKRYVLKNETKALINYELRRKMRQVGVQVQDIGTYLCWQTYVDEPGKDLGVAELMHISKSPDMDKITHPEEIVPQKPFVEKINIGIPYIGDSSEKDEGFKNGNEVDVGWLEETDSIKYIFPQPPVVCKKANYYLSDVKLNTQGISAELTVTDFAVNKDSNEGKFTVRLDYVNFRGQDNINIQADLYWKPNQDLDEIKRKNKDRLDLYTEELESAYRKEYVDAAKDRIKAASNIQTKKYEDLREEERIVVYRRLIQDLLTPKGKISQPDSRTQHVVSELINSIFDVDKMLYFVAPEWWRPRKHYSQSFGTLKPTGKVGSDGKPEMEPSYSNTITDENLVGWGGISGMRKDNYYITEDSSPAKIGSSLGWLLQLDGDNLRNAFLNAPWVKSVIPIRPGKEKAALNWLKQIEGINGITDNDMYTGKEPDLQGKSMLEVLEILSEKVRKKHLDATKTSDIPNPDEPNNIENTVTATPVDKVYEHGFYPLKGGFKAKPSGNFEIFDQWVEVLPTDQVVAVEVKYDPKTGRQV